MNYQNLVVHYIALAFNLSAIESLNFKSIEENF